MSLTTKTFALGLALVSVGVLASVTSTFAYGGNRNVNQNTSTQNVRQFQNPQKTNKKFQQKKSNKTGSVTSTLVMTDEIKNGLLLMREEEKLARDIYLQLAQTYQGKVFSNIAKSEQQHMNAIKKILDTYNIQDPIVNNAVGVFTNPELQNLYNELLAQGRKSLADGIQVGIDIEKLDIKDLEKLLANMGQGTDLYQVYQNLLKGSKNHLNAFEKQL